MSTKITYNSNDQRYRKVKVTSNRDSNEMNNHHFRKKKLYLNRLDQRSHEMIKKDPNNIKYVFRPTEEMQRIAINFNLSLFNFIKYPTKNVQLKMIELYPRSVSFSNVKNMDEEVQLRLINCNPVEIINIQNPTEKVQISVLKQVWRKDYYNFIMYRILGKKSTWFNKEINRLKLERGPLE